MWHLRNARVHMSVREQRLDLANAFGSIPCKLDQLTLTKHQVPSRCRDPIPDYYNNSNLFGSNNTSLYKLEIGIITGCTISVMLFSLVMNILAKC